MVVRCRVTLLKVSGKVFRTCPTPLEVLVLLTTVLSAITRIPVRRDTVPPSRAVLLWKVLV